MRPPMFIVRFLALFQERGELVVKALIIPINFQLLSLSLWRIPACSKPEQAGVSKDGSLERLHIMKTFLNGLRTLPCSSHSWQPPEKLFSPHCPWHFWYSSVQTGPVQSTSPTVSPPVKSTLRPAAVPNLTFEETFQREWTALTVSWASLRSLF